MESYNIVFSAPSATTTNHFKSNCLSRNQRRRMRQKNATHRHQTTHRETNEQFLKNFSSHQLTDNQVSVISKVSSLSQHPWQTRQKSGINSCKILNSFQDECAFNTYFTVKTKNRIRSTLNQTGYHQFNHQLPLKATWKVSRYN